MDPRTPDPMQTHPASTTAASTHTGQSAGNPTGVIPPYSMPEPSTAKSIGANDALRASRRLRTTALTSTRVVASAMHATCRATSPRRPVTITQFAHESSGRW